MRSFRVYTTVLVTTVACVCFAAVIVIMHSGNANMARVEYMSDSSTLN
jgi:hypothetical protein